MCIRDSLLDNAVKFCEEGGTIKIWTYLSDGKVNINISNTGQIIPPEDLKYIFDRFFKVDKSHNRKIPGTGIGLSIVKEIINRHDEKIWVNSQAGMGTVFTFTLSLACLLYTSGSTGMHFCRSGGYSGTGYRS